ncbi:uncharacterized protein LOC119077337 [Bradysia coprophila]|uniref:uncharacterized protein LOC119077337 n=1 Tax=Bradysia coprophila TaxID=38358 RepID=UPI00187DA6C1|nr:uncharacterized protein LOC119077337 [Bradysia coprophila]
MFKELAEGQSDVVACGVWQSSNRSTKDLTSYFDDMCSTWIAPKPQRLDPASLIYLTLSTPVWGLYIFCFICTATLLTTISKIEEEIRNTKIASSTLGRSFLDATNAATSHGITNFPNQISVQVLLISWHLLNLLVGAGYTTMYTSRLTKPGYTKPIDTFEDFAEQGISWITRLPYKVVTTALNESTRPAFQHIYMSKLTEYNDEQLVKSLRTGHYGVFMTIRSNKYPVDLERITHPSGAGIWNLFRFMKVCFYSHFSVFSLRKHSPYTVLFNSHIKRYQECGIIKHWYEELYRKDELIDTLFETHPRGNNEPKSLTLWDMRGAFFVLLTGLFIAIVACLCEFSFVVLKKMLSSK